MLNWTVSTDHQETCQIKGQKDSDCHNYIRVFHGPLTPPSPAHHSHHHHHRLKGATSGEIAEEEPAAADESFIVCGTNAFKPRCRIYDPTLGNFTREFAGVGYSPFDPAQRSTSLLHHGAVYAATVADFGGSDALIYKEPLRTEQNDLKHLSSKSRTPIQIEPDFIAYFYGKASLFDTAENSPQNRYHHKEKLCTRSKFVIYLV
jgi:hypothetical protein